MPKKPGGEEDKAGGDSTVKAEETAQDMACRGSCCLPTHRCCQVGVFISKKRGREEEKRWVGSEGRGVV